MEGKTVAAAAAAAGMGERTAHRWQRGALPSAAKAPRTWRTREDDVWLSEVVPRLVADAAGRLQALTLFEWLCRHPSRFRPGQPDVAHVAGAARSGSRGVFRAGGGGGVRLHGRERPGSNDSGCAVPAPVVRVGAQRLDVCGAGAERDVRGACGVSKGRCGRWARAGGADNLSAATRELRRSGGRQLTARFRQAGHYAALVADSAAQGPRKPSSPTSGRKPPSAGAVVAGRTSSMRRRISPSCGRSSIGRGTGRRRCGWPRSGYTCGRCRRRRSPSTRRFSAGYVSGARSGWAAVRIRCRRG